MAASLALTASAGVMAVLPATVSPARAGTVAAVKSPMHGVLTRGGFSPKTWDGVVNGMAVSANWSDLQTTPGGDIVRPNSIDTMVGFARQINTANPGVNIQVKIRVMGGIYAPSWAKNIGGAPLSVHSSVDGLSGTVGRFWLPAYGSAYADLQSKLAAIYDSYPEVHEVQVTRCTLIWDEPYIRLLTDSLTYQSLTSAGYTVDQDQQCHRDEIDAQKVWQTTPSNVAFNPYEDAPKHADEIFTDRMMAYCRSSLGQRCVLGNESFRADPANPQAQVYADMYDHMSVLGPAISLQTAKMSRVGNLSQALTNAVRLGATAVELGPGYGSYISRDALAGYRDELLAAPLSPVPGPHIIVQAPAASSTVKGSLLISGVATSDSALAAIDYSVATSDSALAAIDYSVDGAPYVPAVGTSTWSATGTVLAVGPHTLVVRATDTAGRQATVSVPVAGADVTAPSVAISTPVSGSTVTSPTTFAGLVTDNYRVASVGVGIRDAATGKWLQADGTWSSRFVTRATTLAQPGSTSSTWSMSWRGSSGGHYSINVIGYDAAGNRSTSASVKFSVA